MGTIKQLSQNENLILLESRAINITQWKAIKPVESGVEIYICDSVYLIKGMNIDLINEINAQNNSVNFSFEFLRSSLRCSKCGGTGIVDWIDKATRVKENVQYLPSTSIPRYIRDKKGSVNIWLSDVTGDSLFTSVPNKRIGEEYCSVCYGCGLRILEWVKQVDTIYFDKC